MNGLYKKEYLIKQTINIKAPAYYLNNREYFVNFINSTFREYGALLNDPEEKDMTCDSLSQAKKGDFSLMTHQMIVEVILTYILHTEDYYYITD